MEDISGLADDVLDLLLEDEGAVNIVAYLSFRLKVGKLDSLLLFLPSVIGIIFAILGPALKLPIRPWEWALGIILFWVMPVYVGYYRGAIARDSMFERLRGFMYILVGFPMYAAQMFLLILGSYQLPGLDEWYLILIVKGIVLLVVVGLLTVVLGNMWAPFQDRIYSLFGWLPGEYEIRLIFWPTMWAAFFFGFSAQTSLYWSAFYSSTDPLFDLSSFLLSLLFFEAGLFFEQTAHKEVCKIREPDEYSPGV
ncbi:MAG: hypothetical protein ACE5IJ_10380 [Thermoplasmata archaeon]